jgi:hypothetical protein
MEDGATQDEQVRKRLRWLAHEWQLLADDVAKAMKCTTYEIACFAEKYPTSVTTGCSSAI